MLLTYLERFSNSIVLPVASGLLLSLALPLIGCSVLALVAFVPFFLFAANPRVNTRRLLLGIFLMAAIYGPMVVVPILALSGSWWTGALQGVGMGNAMLEVFYSIAIIVFGFVASLVTLLPFAFAFRRTRMPLDRVALGPFWALLEWARSTFLTFGYSWGAIGYALIDIPILRDPARVPGGVFLLSAIVLFINLSLFEAICHRGHFGHLEDVRRFSLSLFRKFPATTTLVIIFALTVFVKWVNMIPCTNPPLKVAVVSSTLSTKESATRSGYTYYRTRVEKALKNGAALVVIPENAFPFFIFDEEIGMLSERSWGAFPWKKELYDDFLELSRSYPSATIAVGLHSINGKKRHNSLIFYRNGTPQYTYQRRMLVPFTEYAPLGLPIPIFEPLSPGALHQWGQIGNWRVTGLICSEIGNVGIPTKGAAIIVAPSNDTVFPAPGIAATHHTLARMRALESGAYILRAVKGGISSIIAPDGTVLAQSDQGDILLADIVPSCSKM